jgi:hypothetical protein
MNYLSAFIQLLLAIPKVFGIFRDLWDLYQKNEAAKRERERLASLDALKKAQTKQEIFNANRDYTNNLP